MDLYAKLNLSKSVILSIILNFPLRSGMLFIFNLADFQKIVYSINIYILPCKLDLCVTWTWKNCDFVDLFELSYRFWNFNHFWLRKFSLNFRKLFILSICMFYHANWAYVSRGIEQKVWFCRSFWILLYVLALNFRPCKISINFRNFFVLLIFIFSLINWTYVPRKIEQKLWYYRSIWIFFLFRNLINFRPREFSLNFISEICLFYQYLYFAL